MTITCFLHTHTQAYSNNPLYIISKFNIIIIVCMQTGLETMLGSFCLLWRTSGSSSKTMEPLGLVLIQILEKKNSGSDSGSGN
jgi:hypothetical protein